jgi:hypothetical protein
MSDKFPNRLNLILLAGFLLTAFSLSSLSTADSNNEEQVFTPHPIDDSDEAVSLALLYTGFDTVNNVISQIDPDRIARVITAENKYTDFTREEIDGKRAWQVKFDSVKFALKYNRPLREEDKIFKLMEVDVLLDSISGRLLEIRATNIINKEYEKEDFIYKLPYFFDNNEKFCGMPAIYPKYGFIDVLMKDNYDLISAKEIVGIFILESILGKEPEPVWVVTMLGLPPGLSTGGLVLSNSKHIVGAIDGKYKFPIYKCGRPGAFGDTAKCKQ